MTHADVPSAKPQQLLRLVYLSTAASTNDLGTTQAILSTSSVHNPLSGITGVLCSSQSHFLQVLEGPDQEVLALYGRVAKDPRHHDPVLLSIELSAERLFAAWSMAYIEGYRPPGELYRTLLLRRHVDQGKQQVAALMRSFISELNGRPARRPVVAQS
jgi:Sensors of blue-light using FAD